MEIDFEVGYHHHCYRWKKPKSGTFSGQYFYINECSAEDRYCDVEGLSEYGLIRDFVVQENAKNIDAFTKWGNRFSRWLAENREFTLGLKPKQYLKQQYPFVNMKELLWMLSDGRRIHLPYVWDYEWEVEPGNLAKV